MGGGFGSKNGPDDYTYIAADLARETGRPVKCALTRREENLAAGHRNATVQRLRAGARSDGTLTALEGDFVNATGWGGWVSSTGGPMELLYGCENVRIAERGAKLNSAPMKAFRAPGFVEGTFGLECLIDELAAKLDLDPLEFRRRNHSDHDAVDGRPFSSKNLLECYGGPSGTGTAGRKCGRAATRPGSTVSGSRARSGTAAADRRPMPGCGSAPTRGRW